MTVAVMDLNKLAEMHGQEFVREILASFLEETTQLMTRLPEAVKRQDSKAAGGAAHQLKGLAAVCAAPGLQDLSTQVEVAINSSDWTSAEALCQAMLQEHVKIAEFINSNLKN